MKRKRILKNICLFFMIGLSSACGNESSIDNPADFQPLQSRVLIDLYIDASAEQWKLHKAELLKFENPVAMPGSLNGDHAIIVKNSNGAIQYVTVTAHDSSSSSIVYNEITRDYEEVTLPNPELMVIRVPIDAASQSIQIEDEQGNSYVILDDLQEAIPQEVFSKSTLTQASLTKLSTHFQSIIDVSSHKEEINPVLLLQTKYPHIYFGRVHGFLNTKKLEDKALAQLILNALDKIPSLEVIHSIEEISFVKDPDSIYLYNSTGVTLGKMYNQKILLNEAYIADSQSEVNYVFAHEAAHAFSYHYVKSQYGNEWMNYIPFEQWWMTGISNGFQIIQDEFRELRSQNQCSEPFVAAEYMYKADGGQGSDRYFYHGFASEYGSKKFEEDFAELYSFVINTPEKVAGYWSEGNVFDKKISYFLKLGMITQEIYDHIKQLAQENPDLYTFEFHYRGVQEIPLHFVLNEVHINSDFFGAGVKNIELPGELLFLNPQTNTLFLETSYDGWNADYDDIEVAELRMRHIIPVSATTGCEGEEIVFEALDPIHLGDDDCNNDQYCNSYSELKGTEYEWNFVLP